MVSVGELTMISVIIPCDKEQMNLVRCLNAIKRQTYKDVQIILLSKECDQLLKEKYHIDFVRCGEDWGHCLTDAIKLAQGEYLFFCKVNSVIPAGTLERLLSDCSDDVMPYMESRTELEGAYTRVSSGITSIWGKLFSTRLIEGINFDLSVSSQLIELKFVTSYCEKIKAVHFINNSIIYDVEAAEESESEKQVMEVDIWREVLQSINGMSQNVRRYFVRELVDRISKEFLVDEKIISLSSELCHKDYEFNYVLASPLIKQWWMKAYNEIDELAYEKFYIYLTSYENDHDYFKLILQTCDLSESQYEILKNNTMRDAIFFIREEERMMFGREAFLERKVESLMALAKVIEKELGLSIVGSLTTEHQIINGLKDGLVKLGSGWYYFSNGEIDRSYKGLAKNIYGWFYVENGAVNHEYNGIEENEYGSWYVKNGKIDCDVNGYKKIGAKEAFFLKGKVDKEKNGMIKVDSTWKYFKEGLLDKEFVGLATNEYGLWYIENGTINYKYTGLVETEQGWRYVSKGKIDREFIGFAKNSDGWWYVTDGTIAENQGEVQKELEHISDEYERLTGTELAQFSIENYENGELGLRTISDSLLAWAKNKVKK